MSLDPLSGLDPLAPATTLYKEVIYEYTPPLNPPVLPPSSSGSYGNGQASNTYYLVDANGVQRQVTFAEYMNAVGGW